MIHHAARLYYEVLNTFLPDWSRYPMPNQPKNAMHGVRVSDDLWHAAQAEAERRGETVSEAIRRSLRRYVRPRKDAA